MNKVNFVNIPQELKENASFCVWKMEKRNGKGTKVPYNPKTGQMARINDPETFCDFGTAMRAYAMGGWDGIGFRVSEGIGATTRSLTGSGSLWKRGWKRMRWVN